MIGTWRFIILFSLLLQVFEIFHNKNKKENQAHIMCLVGPSSQQINKYRLTGINNSCSENSTNKSLGFVIKNKSLSVNYP